MKFLRDERLGASFMLLAACVGFATFNLGFLDAGALIFKQQALPFVSQFGMALFFVLIGFELRSEFSEGLFRNPKAVFVPATAALLGVLIPAAGYLILALSLGSPSSVISAWPVVTATDVSFALMAFSLLAKALPIHVRAFLLSFAVIDDIIATIALAVGFQKFEALTPLISTATALLLAFSLSSTNVQRVIGVLSPLVAFAILPLFAFLSMQITFDLPAILTGTGSVLVPLILMRPITKWLGVFFGAILGNRLVGPNSALAMTNRDFLRVASFAGIGFTVSLLAADLAFGSSSKLFAAAATLTVLASLLSVCLAFITLKARRVLK